MNNKRKMQIQGEQAQQSPELTKQQIKAFIKDDFDKMASTIYMIRNDEGMLDALAEKFHARITSDVQKEVATALEAQKSQFKQN